MCSNCHPTSEHLDVCVTSCGAVERELEERTMRPQHVNVAARVSRQKNQ